MVTNVPDWICNFLLWTAIVTTVVLTVDQFTPILNGLTGLVVLGVVLVLSLLWPNLSR